MNFRTVTGIHSCPRSGSSWLLNVFNSVPTTRCLFQPLFSYTHKGRLDESSSTKDIQSCWEEFYNSTDEFALMRNDWFTDSEGRNRLPQFEKVAAPMDLVFKHVRYHHLIHPILERDSQVKFVAIVRDPRATINSFLRSAEFDPAWSREDQWRTANLKNQNRPEEFYGFVRWKESARLFLDAASQFPDRVRVVRYVDLLKDTDAEIRTLFDFCELEFGETTEKFLVESKQRSSGDYGVYRQKSDDLGWIGQLEKNIVNAIETDLAMAENRDLRQFIDDTNSGD